MCQGTGMETTGEAIVVPEVPRQARLGCAPDTAALNQPIKAIVVRGSAPVGERPVFYGDPEVDWLENERNRARQVAIVAEEARKTKEARAEAARLAAGGEQAITDEQARVREAAARVEAAKVAEEARKAEAARVEAARVEAARVEAERVRAEEAKAEAARADIAPVTNEVQSEVAAAFASTSSPVEAKPATEVARESDSIGRLMQIVSLNPSDNAEKIALFNELWHLFIGAATNAPGRDAIKKSDRQTLKRLRTAIEGALSSQGFEANSLRDYIPAWLR